MLTVQHLTKRYPNHTAVDEVSFSVREGETLVLLGTSGCGKTTTLKMINRLIEPTAGRVDLNGTDIRRQNVHDLRRTIGYVIQETGLFPHYTIAQNIAVVPQLLGWADQRIRQRTAELLAMLHLPEASLHQYPDQLSGGQRQRVGLARALAADPPVVLMDEPLGALDPVTRASIRREFRHLDALRQKTIVMVTHDVQEAFELGDRVCLMDKGRIQQIGTPKELLLRPANDFVRRFFDDQRLTLQLQTVTLQDLLPLLATYQPMPSDTLLLPPDTSVSDALKAMAEGQTAAVQLADVVGPLTSQNLLSAFGQWRQSPPS
ncbi:hypothetical protein GCM10023189_21610 [Nibrella saemangeumensis]|uniref:ABC transporter domain-containing protein n=1 Tax=Nibrella saemangeumensis TaxID=1084526 RepID=A0ABP8MR90_9BACT